MQPQAQVLQRHKKSSLEGPLDSPRKHSICFFAHTIPSAKDERWLDVAGHVFKACCVSGADSDIALSHPNGG